MSKVIAITDVRTANGLLVATEGTEGVALYRHRATPSNYFKMPVRWGRRRKVYWCNPDDLRMLDNDLDKHSYIALLPHNLLNFPPLPAPPDIYDYHFGRNLRQFRRDKKLSQTELAERLTFDNKPTSQTTISYWERQREAPRGRYIHALSSALEIPAFLFFVNFSDCVWLGEAERYVTQLKQSLCADAEA
jgi:transcriptional regulator with XRE-family HTH domain